MFYCLCLEYIYLCIKFNVKQKIYDYDLHSYE